MPQPAAAKGGGRDLGKTGAHRAGAGQRKGDTMRFFTSIIAGAVAAFVALGADAAFAGAVKVSGSFENTIVSKHAMPAGDRDGHVMLFTEAQGRNTDTSNTGFLDGASASVREFADLVQGNGKNEGYVVVRKGEDATFADIKGTVMTTTNDDGTPNIRFKGTWRYIGGTGRYDGIEGEGTYSGYYTSETTYHVDWEGFYRLESASVSER